MQVKIARFATPALALFIPVVCFGIPIGVRFTPPSVSTNAGGCGNSIVNSAGYTAANGISQGVVVNGFAACTVTASGLFSWTLTGGGNGVFDDASVVVGLNSRFGTANVDVRINSLPVTLPGIGGSLPLPVTLFNQPLVTWQVTFSDVLTIGQFYQSGFCLWIGSPVGCNPNNSQQNPLLGTGTNGNWFFNGVLTGTWTDPPFATGYDYSGLTGTTFTSIRLPTGYGSAFEVLHGSGFGTSLGTFGDGASVDFLTLAGSPLSTFRIRGINPAVDVALPDAFPLQVFFSADSGSFSQVPLADVPEPRSLLLLASGMALICIRGRFA